MNNVKVNWFYNFLAGIIGAVVLVGGAFMFGIFEAEVIVNEGETTIVEGPDGPKGDQGVRGYTGSKGDAGSKGDTGSVGPMGPIGLTGANAYINISDLADEVADELEDRETRLSITYSDGDGNHTRTFEIDESDTYEFQIRNFASNDFYVSLEDEDGEIFPLLDTEGHISTKVIRSLDEGTWTLHVSSEGDWSVRVRQL